MPVRSATAQAQEQIQRLLSEPGRTALLRREVLQMGIGSGPCDRALRKLHRSGMLTRFGHGVYGCGSTKLFTALPQILHKLGYMRVPGETVKGYSQRLGGTFVRLDKPCSRTLRARGVWLTFEKPDGTPIRRRSMPTSPHHVMPSRREIEDHAHRFEHCHSLARAEKDLLVHKALDVFDNFDSADWKLALDGGTSLACYYSISARFSEDLDIRLVLPRATPPRGTTERAAYVLDAGEHFARHIANELPWLTRTRKGRIRKDGIVQSFIFRYEGKERSPVVLPGIKFELVDIPARLPLKRAIRKTRAIPVVSLPEIAAGKWNALIGRIPDRSDSNPDLVRHVLDIGIIHGMLADSSASAMREITCADPLATPDRTLAALASLCRNPRWQQHYSDYLDRMGTRKVSLQPTHHPTWELSLRRICLNASETGLIDASELEPLLSEIPPPDDSGTSH